MIMIIPRLFLLHQTSYTQCYHISYEPSDLFHPPNLELNVPPPCRCANSIMAFRTQVSHAVAISWIDQGSGRLSRVSRKATSTKSEMALIFFLSWSSTLSKMSIGELLG